MLFKILVALDRSAASQHVFAAALACAQVYQAELLLAHVLSAEEEGSPLPLPPTMTNLYWSPGNELDLKTWHQEWVDYEQACKVMLESYVEQAQAEGLTATYRQIAGIPGRSICKLARSEKVDLVVVGSRGLSKMGEILLGSVSNYVLHHAPCDVLTVRQGR